MRLLLCAMTMWILSQPTFAVRLDLENRQTIATYREFNLARNLLVVGNDVVLPESEINGMLIIDTQTHQTTQIPLTQQPQDIHLWGDSRALINDAFDGVFSIIDIAKRKKVDEYVFPLTQGPIYTAFDQTFVYGSDYFHKQITKFDLKRKKLVKKVPAGSGPHDIKLLGDKLYVLERGAVHEPGDDHLAVYDKQNLTLLKRVELSGLSRRMTVVGDEICIGYDFESRVSCGTLENGWRTAPTPEFPDSMVKVEDNIAVLTRGFDEQAYIVLLAHDQKELVEVGRYSLKDRDDLWNPRFLHYDASTKRLYIKADTQLVQLPVIP